MIELIIAVLVAIASGRAIFIMQHSVAVTACVTDHGHDHASLLRCYCPCHRTTGKRAPIPRKSNL